MCNVNDSSGVPLFFPPLCNYKSLANAELFINSAEAQELINT